MQLEQEHLKMLHAIAWQMYRRNKIDVEELFSEACLIAAEKLPKFDSSRGQVSTFLYTVVTNHLIRYVNKQHKLNKQELPTTEYIINAPQEQTLLFMEELRELSKYSKKLCKQIFENPEEYEELSMKQLTKKLRKNNWTLPTIRKTYKEIRTFLNKN